MPEKVVIVRDSQSRENVVEFGEEEVHGEEGFGFGLEVGGTTGTYLVVEDYRTGGREVFQWEEVIVSEPWSTVQHNPTRKKQRPT